MSLLIQLSTPEVSDKAIEAYISSENEERVSLLLQTHFLADAPSTSGSPEKKQLNLGIPTDFLQHMKAPDWDTLRFIIMEILPHLMMTNASWYRELEIMSMLFAQKTGIKSTDKNSFPWTIENGKISLTSVSTGSDDFAISCAAFAYSRSLIANRNDRTMMNDISVPWILADASDEAFQPDHGIRLPLLTLRPKASETGPNVIPMFGGFRRSELDWAAIRRSTPGYDQSHYSTLLFMLPYFPWWLQSAYYQSSLIARKNSSSVDDSRRGFLSIIRTKTRADLTLNEYYLWYLFNHRKFGYDRRFRPESSDIANRFASITHDMTEYLTFNGLRFDDLLTWAQIGPLVITGEPSALPIQTDKFINFVNKTLTPGVIIDRVCGTTYTLDGGGSAVPSKFEESIKTTDSTIVVHSRGVDLGPSGTFINALIADTRNMLCRNFLVSRQQDLLDFRSLRDLRLASLNAIADPSDPVDLQHKWQTSSSEGLMFSLKIKI